MKTTDKVLLKRALRFATRGLIHDYLYSIRTSGGLKYEAHRELCNIFVHIFLDLPERELSVLHPCWKKVHEDTQQFTGRLESEIGFPEDWNEDIDYHDLEPKFFEKFYKLAVKSINEYQKHPEKYKRMFE
jgi:hypothetical protein